jgi:diguanylate cyclase (GGDEF)-like protein
VSLHIRKVLEQCYGLNAAHHDVQVITVSFADQAEVRSDFDTFCKKKGVNDPIRIELTPNDSFSPIVPVLYIIKALLKRNNIPVEDVSKILSLEQYEKQIMLNMLQNSPVLRNFYMPSDVEYIKFRMRKHITSLMNHLLSNCEPVMIGISNLQYVGNSSLVFLYELLKPKTLNQDSKFYLNPTFKNQNTQYQQKRIHNLFAEYKEEAFATPELKENPNCIIMLSFSPENMSTEWLDWENKLERVCTLIRPEDSEFGFEIDNSKYNWPIQNYQAKEISSVEDAFDRCCQLLNYFCSDEVIKISQTWLKHIRMTANRESNVNDYEEQLYHVMGRALLYKNEYEDALISFDLMYEKAQYSNNNDNACRAYIELAYTHIFRSDFESVLHFAEMAAHLGEISMNMRLVAISNFCLFVAYDRSSIKFGYHNIVTLLNNLERQDLLKEQTYVLRNSFAQAFLDPNISLKMALEFCSKAVTIASSYGIKHELAAANHCRGIVLFMLNRIPDALHAYRLSEEQYDLIEVHIELTHVYNSIGFLLNETEDYSRAHEYYLKALRNSIKLNDYSEITITLYNIAQLYQLSGKFGESLLALNILQEVMAIRGTYKLPFHNVHHIIFSKVLVYINLKQTNLAEQMLKRSFNLRTTVPLKSNELFIFNLLQTVLYATNGNQTKALALFDKVEQQLNDTNITPQEYVLFYVYAIKIFALFSKYEKRYKYFKKGFAFTLKNQLFNSQKLITNAWMGRDNIYEGYSAIEPPVSELNQIIPLVNQERKVNVLWQQVHEMRLISMLHSFSLNVQTYEQLAAETLRLLSSHFNINGGMIYFVNDKKNSAELIKEFNASKEYPDFKYSRIAKFVEQHITPDIQEFTDLTIGNTEIHHIVIYPLIDQDILFGQMLLFTFERKTDYRHEEFDSISFIAQQLSSQLTMMIQRIKLIRVSTTDMLTGLYNRMEFHNQISTVISKLKIDEQIALGFIDLDNFKYYNDNLGHDVGDKLLIWFSNLLNTIKTPGDIACRWGGDEFLLLMKNCSAEEASRRMQNVLDSLKSKNGYKEQIAEFLGHPVENLPQKYYLSCSIGVMDSSSLPRPFTETELLTHADQALYEVKRTGKGKVLNFENMTHEADDQIVESNR